MPVSPFLRYTVLRYPSNRTLAQCSLHSGVPKWELFIYGYKNVKNRQIILYSTFIGISKCDANEIITSIPCITANSGFEICMLKKLLRADSAHQNEHCDFMWLIIILLWVKQNYVLVGLQMSYCLHVASYTEWKFLQMWKP